MSELYHSASQKQCLSCKNFFPTTTEYFHRDKRHSDGLRSQCKLCVCKREKEKYNRPDVHERRLAQIKVRNRLPKVKEYNRIRSKIYLDRPEVRERSRARHHAHYLRPEVQERERIRGKEYRSRPDVRERVRTYVRNRYARKKAIPGSTTATQIQGLLKRQKHNCYYCGAKFEKKQGKYIYHIDHTFPISREGARNDIDHLVLTCPTCNLSKGDKYPWEWPEGGRLL